MDYCPHCGASEVECDEHPTYWACRCLVCGHEWDAQLETADDADDEGEAGDNPPQG